MKRTVLPELDFWRPRLVQTVSLEIWLEDAPEAERADLEAIHPALSEALDGRRSLDEAVGRLLLGGHLPAAIYAALRRAHRLNLLVESEPDLVLTPAQRAGHADQISILGRWCAGRPDLGQAPPAVAGEVAMVRLRKSCLVLVEAGRHAQRLLEQLLPAGLGRAIALESGQAPGVLTPGDGLEVRRAGDALPEADLEAGESTLLLYAPDRFDGELAGTLNGIALERGVRFLGFHAGADAVEMGPLVEPRVTACYACCRARREAAHFGWKAEPGAEDAGVGLPFAVGLDLLALEVLKILSGAATPMTRNRLWRLDLASGVAALHPVLKLPRCPACGVAARPPRKLWIR